MMQYWDFFFLTLDTGLLIQERKRPRKLSHKVLECTIEEVSVAPTKKKVCWDLNNSWEEYEPATFVGGKNENSSS